MEANLAIKKSEKKAAVRKDKKYEYHYNHTGEIYVLEIKTGHKRSPSEKEFQNEFIEVSDWEPLK